MSHHKNYIEDVKVQLDRLGEELFELDAKLKSAGKNADAWSKEQMHELRADWHACQAHFERMNTQGKASFESAKVDAERHWKALEEAVKTYRQKLQRNAA